MRMARVSLAIVLLTSGVPSVCMAPASAHQSDYVLETLVRVDFGDSNSEIGLYWLPEEGPPVSVCGFIVDAADNVYLGDAIAGRIKRFAPSGELVMATQVVPNGTPGLRLDGSGTLDTLRHFTVDRQGNIYAIHYGYHVLTKFSPDGRWLWSRTFRQLITEELAAQADISLAHRSFYSVWATHDGSVLLQVATHGRYPTGVLVGPKGDLLSLQPDYRVLSWAHGWASTSPGPELQGSAVTIPRPDGTIARQAQLDMQADGGIHFEGCLGEPSRRLFQNSDGDLYSFSEARLPTTVAYDPVRHIGLEKVINRFDSEGRFIEEWRFIHSVFRVRWETTLDQEGNIYHIRFDDQGLEVVRYRRIPQGSTPPEGAEVIGGGRIHQLVSLRVADTTITPLVLLAAKANLPVEWDPDTRVATVTTKAGPLVLDPDRSRATLDGEPVEIGGPLSIRYGRLWVPAVQVARLLDLPVRESKDKRIVCLAWPR